MQLAQLNAILGYGPKSTIFFYYSVKNVNSIFAM